MMIILDTQVEQHGLRCRNDLAATEREAALYLSYEEDAWY